MGTAAAFKSSADDEVEMPASPLPPTHPIGHYAPGKGGLCYLLKLKYFVTSIEKSSVCPLLLSLIRWGQQQPLKPLLMMRSRCPPIPYPLLTPSAIMRLGRGNCAELAIKKRAASKVLYQQQIGKLRSKRKQGKNRKKGEKHCKKKKRIWKLYFSAG
ncbi:hypothetical protein CDAR_522141 [Caerostris darwini]|uniref:Uncharacterized protein n=1 Tax=Caerostris darwini TaxID=1538125 RepID=A0AAV4SLJ6_9ARAC|nr:hypothetical protein CDAR_522141 [Caerostris darwini]